MTFTVNSLSRCSGQSHYTANITFQSGPTVDLVFALADLQLDPFADVTESRQTILDRLRSAAKEANAVTFAQAKAALEGQTFKV